MTENSCAIAAHPLVKRGRIDLSEVDFELDIPILEVGEVRDSTVDSLFNLVSDEEHGARGSVVGSSAGVFRNSATEL